VCVLDRAISKLPFELRIGPIFYGRLQNLQTSEVTFAHAHAHYISYTMHGGHRCTSYSRNQVPHTLDTIYPLPQA